MLPYSKYGENKSGGRTKKNPQKEAVKSQTKKPLKKGNSKPKENVFSPNLKCSFCGKPSKNARRLIALQPPSKTCICDECIEVCVKILLQDSPLEWHRRIINIFAEQAETNKIPPEQEQIKLKAKQKNSVIKKENN